MIGLNREGDIPEEWTEGLRFQYHLGLAAVGAGVLVLILWISMALIGIPFEISDTVPSEGQGELTEEEAMELQEAIESRDYETAGDIYSWSMLWNPAKFLMLNLLLGLPALAFILIMTGVGVSAMAIQKARVNAAAEVIDEEDLWFQFKE